MYEYLNGNYLLSKEHFGFCKNHSTEFAAINLVDDISKKIEHCNTPGTLYINLSKALDTLWFGIIIYKLSCCLV